MLVSDIIERLRQHEIKVSAKSIIQLLEKMGVEHERNKPYSIPSELAEKVIIYYEIKKGVINGHN